MLVHLAAPTGVVVVTSALSRSVAVGRGGGFEVLRVAIGRWPT